MNELEKSKSLFRKKYELEKKVKLFVDSTIDIVAPLLITKNHKSTESRKIDSRIYLDDFGTLLIFITAKITTKKLKMVT